VDKSDQPRQVIHLHLLENDEHHYFGSISAMYQHFTHDELGIAKQSLYNRWKDEPYRNNMIILRKGRLIQKKNTNKSKETNFNNL